MSDPIKAALDAAAQASHDAVMAQECCDAGPDTELPIVAAAVAAFLRALPPGLRVDYTFVDLADAIEEPLAKD